MNGPAETWYLYHALTCQSQESTLDILYACMDISLRLAHPFMPFVTEVIFLVMDRIAFADL